jgi:TRAP-type C4-dicarboxylate transport system substrate-binding protein
MRKSIWRTMLAGLAAAGLSTSAGAVEKFVFASYMAEQYTVARSDAWLMNEIEKRSNGEIKFERYFNGTLLKAADLFPGLQSGAADIVSGTPAAYNRNDYRLSNVIQPYLSSKADAVNAALKELYKNNDAFRAEYEKRNARMLYVVPWAENTFWASKPLGKVEDFKGMRIRGVQSVATAVQKLGGTPVTMAWPEAVEGLTRGVVDAVSSAPFDSAVLGGIYETAKFGTDGGDMGIFSFASIAMNKARWDKLSDKHKALFEQVSAEAPAKFLEFLDQELQAAADKLCTYKGNLTVTLFSDADKKKIRETVAPVIQQEWIKWAAETNRGVDTAKFVEQFTALVREGEKTSTWRSGFDRLNDPKCKK